MNTFFAINEEKYKPFVLLRNELEQRRDADVARRLASNPSPTEEESMLGAFIEMYEPHLRSIIFPLLKKGYSVDVSSGFDGRYSEYQSLHGVFPIDELMINKLAKIGVKVQKNARYKSIKFLPAQPELEAMTAIFEQVAATLPQRQETASLLNTTRASQFRMTYIPHDITLQRLRLFEILMFTIVENMATEIKNRLAENPRPDAIEANIGVFREMIEPQVRDAVVEFNRKGYSTDASGFMNASDGQIIDGDFLLDEAVIAQLTNIGVTVETNPSGYTRLHFKPSEANLESIKKTWDYVASLLPDKGFSSPPSMTRKARAFRSKHLPE